MQNRTKLLVHVNRISTVFRSAVLHGADGTLEGKFGAEHSEFKHHLLSLYLAGTLAYLEGEDGAYSWNKRGQNHADFDTFCGSFPAAPKQSYAQKGVTKQGLDALAELRNAIVHNDGDLAKNRNANSFSLVAAANIPGVTLNGSLVRLEDEFLEHMRLVTYAVRNYFGES